MNEQQKREWFRRCRLACVFWAALAAAQAANAHAAIEQHLHSVDLGALPLLYVAIALTGGAIGRAVVLALRKVRG